MQPGTTIGPYVVRRHLGDGGMGSVWLADDTRLHRQVALKVLRAAKGADTAGHDRMMREARAAAALNHPNIATVYDVVDIDGEITIVFEHVNGRTLASAIPDGAWPIARVIELGKQLAKALSVAHAHGIVHRDLKPANVMIGDDDQIKVLDFGIARLLPVGTTITSGETLSGAGFMGTPAYAAPEQMLSSAVDERADLYSLGVVLFEMASGQRPFPGHDVITQGSAKMSAPAPTLSSVGVSAPPALEALVAALLQRKPADRPASAADVLRELRAISGDPSTGPLPFLRTRSLRWVAAAVLLTAAVIALVLGIRGPMVATLSAAQPVVAVLPLRNTSADASKDFVAAGLSESLIASLASTPSMVVLSRSAVADAIKRASDTTRAVKDLGANLVIDGSVQQSGDRLRVSINVVRADQIAWARTFDGTIEKVFDLQTRMALAVSEALSTPWAGEGKQPTTRPALEAYWRGRAFLDRWDVKGNIDAAIEALSESVADDPDFALAHAGLGLAYWYKYGETRDQQFARLSVDSGAKAAAIDPNQPEVRFALAMSLDGTGRRDEAVAELKHALSLRPTFEEARRKLGLVLAAQGKIEDGVAEFDRAIALRPRFWGGYSDKGFALLSAARYQEAAAAFEQAVALQPDNHLVFQQLGSAYQFMGDTAKAIAAYQNALSIQPNFGSYSNLGTLQYDRGEYPSAVEAYQKAIALQPRLAGLHRNLGDAYAKMGRRADAMRAYATAVERAQADLAINPRSARGNAALAVYLAKAGRTAEALSKISTAVTIAPEDVQVRYRAAVVSALAGRTEDALNQIAAAIERGYSVRAVQEEEDFGALRSTPRFISLTTPNRER